MIIGLTNWASGLLFVIGGFLVWCFYHVAIYHILSPLRKIPSPTTSNILTGNTFDIFTDFPSFFVRWARRLKSGVICIRLFMGWRFVALCDKDSSKHVLVDNKDNYKTPSNFVSAFFKINTRVKRDKQSRQMFEKAMDKLTTSYIPVAQNITECLIARWQKEASSSNNLVEIESIIRKTILDICLKTTLGMKITFQSNSQSEVSFLDDFNENENGLSWMYLLPGKLKQIFNSTKSNHCQETSVNFDEFVEKTIQDKMSKQTDEGKMQTNFLSHLLVLNDRNSGSKLSKEQICQCINSFLYTSVETTSSTITRCLQILARHRRIQERVAKEVTSYLPPPGQPITEDCLENMTYLGCIVNEVLRLYSPIPFVIKEAIKDGVINGYQIPRGTLIACTLSALHRNSIYWENPDQFNPDRFLNRNINDHTFLPFGAGDSMSFGVKMAVVKMKLTLALILRHFRVRPHEGQVYETVYNGSLKQSPSVKCRLLPMDDYY